MMNIAPALRRSFHINTSKDLDATVSISKKTKTPESIQSRPSAIQSS